MSSILQILPYRKFEINWTSGSKVVAKKLTFGQQKANFLSITFEPVVWSIPNFESGKICLVDCLFASGVFKNEVARLKDKWPGWEQNSCTYYPESTEKYRIYLPWIASGPNSSFFDTGPTLLYFVQAQKHALMGPLSPSLLVSHDSG